MYILVFVKCLSSRVSFEFGLGFCISNCIVVVVVFVVLIPKYEYNKLNDNSP